MTSPLYPTPTRKALLRAIAEGNGRIYFEAGDVWDGAVSWRVTERMKELINAGWVYAMPVDGDKGPGELGFRIYYRLTEEGRRIIQRGQS